MRKSLALALSLLGLFDSLYLLYSYTSPSRPMVCIGTGCDAVRASAYSTLWGVSMPVFGVLGYTLLGIVIIAESLFSARLARWAGYAPGKRNKPTRRSDPIPRIGHFGHIRTVVSRYACRSEVRAFRMRRARSISDQTPGCTDSCTTPR